MSGFRRLATTLRRGDRRAAAEEENDDSGRSSSRRGRRGRRGRDDDRSEPPEGSSFHAGIPVATAATDTSLPSYTIVLFQVRRVVVPQAHENGLFAVITYGDPETQRSCRCEPVRHSDNATAPNKILLAITTHLEPTDSFRVHVYAKAFPGMRDILIGSTSIRLSILPEGTHGIKKWSSLEDNAGNRIETQIKVGIKNNSHRSGASATADGATSAGPSGGSPTRSSPPSGSGDRRGGRSRGRGNDSGGRGDDGGSQEEVALDPATTDLYGMEVPRMSVARGTRERHQADLEADLTVVMPFWERRMSSRFRGPRSLSVLNYPLGYCDPEGEARERIIEINQMLSALLVERTKIFVREQRASRAPRRSSLRKLRINTLRYMYLYAEQSQLLPIEIVELYDPLFVGMYSELDMANNGQISYTAVLDYFGNNDTLRVIAIRAFNAVDPDRVGVIQGPLRALDFYLAYQQLIFQEFEEEYARLLTDQGNVEPPPAYTSAPGTRRNSSDSASDDLMMRRSDSGDLDPSIGDGMDDVDGDGDDEEHGHISIANTTANTTVTTADQSPARDEDRPGRPGRRSRPGDDLVIEDADDADDDDDEAHPLVGPGQWLSESAPVLAPDELVIPPRRIRSRADQDAPASSDRPRRRRDDGRPADDDGPVFDHDSFEASSSFGSSSNEFFG